MESPVTYFSSSLSLSLFWNIHMWWGWLYLGCFNNCIQLHHWLILKMIEYRKSKITKSAEFFLAVLHLSFSGHLSLLHTLNIQSLFVTLIPKSPNPVTLIHSDRAPGPNWPFLTLSPCTPFTFPSSFFFLNFILYISLFLSWQIQMWELDQKEGWAPKNCCFLTVVLEKTWESLGQQGDKTSQS